MTIRTMTSSVTARSLTTTLPDAHRASRVRALLFETTPSIGPTILRLTLAVVLFAHGAQKLLGWYGGEGIRYTLDNMTATGLPAVVVLFIVLTEFFGALLLLLGFLTRVAALCTLVLMAGAVALVHGEYGFFMNWAGQKSGEGIEYHLLVMGMAAALLVMGGGSASLDQGMAHRRSAR